MSSSHPLPAHGWTPLEITLEVVTGRQSERAQEDTIVSTGFADECLAVFRLLESRSQHRG